jgi:peptidoglycan hydrolase-like protein with peptidoglycan-binding domain
MTLLYGHSSHEILELQQALVAHGFDVGPEGPDGGFGDHTLQAVKDAQAAFKLNPVDGVVRDDLLLALGIKAPPKPSIFDQLGAILSLLNLLKGKSMTNDQINGIVRLILGLAAGYFTAKGIGSQALWDWISAGVLTAIPAAWSWYSNRPKTILSIADKKALNQ